MRKSKLVRYPIGMLLALLALFSLAIAWSYEAAAQDQNQFILYLPMVFGPETADAPGGTPGATSVPTETPEPGSTLIPPPTMPASPTPTTDPSLPPPTATSTSEPGVTPIAPTATPTIADPTPTATSIPGGNGTEPFPVNALILPVGDSRVEGNSPAYESYRYELWKNLIDNSWAFDYVGTQEDPTNYDDYQDFIWDPDHEGYGGATTADIEEAIFNYVDLEDPPDIVLLGIGGNDYLTGSATAE